IDGAAHRVRLVHDLLVCVTSERDDVAQRLAGTQVGRVEADIGAHRHTTSSSTRTRWARDEKGPTRRDATGDTTPAMASASARPACSDQSLMKTSPIPATQP